MAGNRDRELRASAFDLFLAQRASDLKQISHRTHGEQTPEDVGQSAWLIADEIAKRRGHEVDFADPADQEVVLRWLHSEFVGFSEQKIRNAFALDREREKADDRPDDSQPWFTAPPESDPLVYLLQREEVTECRDVQRRLGYSQASTYILLIFRFGGDLPALSTYLVVSRRAFIKRVRGAVAHVKAQPSLFDGIEFLDPDYLPRPARRRPPRVVPSQTGRQLLIRLNRMSHVRYVLSSIYWRFVAFISPRHVLAR